MKCELSLICGYVNETIATSELSKFNYISTENMLPNKNGIEPASSFPNQKVVKAFKKGDILISNIRPYFKKIWLAEYNGGCSNDVLVIRAKKGTNKEFLYYLLSENKFFDYVTASSKGTKMPRGDKTAIMNYLVPEFEEKEQIKIANLLGTIDKKIKINKKINDNLEKQMELYFRYLFIDNINSNWEIGCIADIGTVIGGGTPSKAKSEYYTNNGIAWITPKDLSNQKSKFISRGENDITELGLKNSSAKIMPKGTILFSSRAPIGYIAIANNDITTNQGFKSIIPNIEFGTSYIYYLLKQNISIIESMASGSTFKEVSGKTMKEIPVIIPDLTTLATFNNFCNKLFEKQKNLEKESLILANIRNYLLNILMSNKFNFSKI